MRLKTNSATSSSPTMTRAPVFLTDHSLAASPASPRLITVIPATSESCSPKLSLPVCFLFPIMLSLPLCQDSCKSLQPLFLPPPQTHPLHCFQRTPSN